jgi:hypothetical protein
MTTTIGGVENDVIERWLLDASQYQAEIDSVVKALDKEAKAERDLERVRKEMSKATEEATKTQGELRDVVKNLASEVPGLGTTIGVVSGAISGGLVVGVQQGIAALEKFGAAVVEAGKQAWEWFKRTEEDVVVFGKYAEAVDGVRTATRNLIDEDSIEQNVRRMSFAERKASQEEMNALAVASFELAKRQGTSAKEAFDQLTEAYARGTTRGLKELGISLEGTNTLYEKQGWLMAELTRIAREHQVEIDTPLKERKARENELLSIEKERSQLLYKEKGLAETVHALERVRFEFDKQWLGFKFQALTAILSTVRAIAAFDSMMDRWFKSPAAPGTVAMGRGPDGHDFWGQDEGHEFWDDEGTGVKLKLPGTKIKGKTPTKGGRGGARQRAGYSPADAYNGSPDDMLAFGSTPKLNLASDMPGYDMGAGGSDAMALAAAMITAQQKETKALWDQEKATKGAEYAMLQYHETLKKTADSIKNLGVGAFSQFGSAIWQAADAAIQGGEAFDKAMLGALKSSLFRIATESTAMSLMALGRWAFSWFTDEGALASAGYYAAAAGVAGGAALGISAASSSGSSGGGSSAASAGASSYRPSYGTSQERQQQKWVIKVVAGSDDPLLNQALASAKFRAIAVDDEAN